MDSDTTSDGGGKLTSSTTSERSSLVYWLDFYGVRARLEFDDREVADRVLEDFHFFVSEEPGGHQLAIRAWRETPDYDSLPELTATVHTPRNICYTDGETTYIDYFGKALGVYRRDSNNFEVVAPEVHMLHEIVYLTLLSRAGELLDKRGLHRLHALAVGGRGKSALFMMDSGGGKTSLALELLRRPDGFQLISEDSPLIDPAGQVFPFPLRFGVIPPVPQGIPEEHVYYLKRMEFEPKYLISLKAFEGRLARGQSDPALLFIGRRRLGTDCVIRPAGTFEGFKSLVRNLVVGVGIYQGLEFLLRTSTLELLRGTRMFLSRLRAALSLLRRSDVFVVELGRNKAYNAEKVVEFLNNTGFGESR